MIRTMEVHTDEKIEVDKRFYRDLLFLALEHRFFSYYGIDDWSNYSAAMEGVVRYLNLNPLDSIVENLPGDLEQYVLLGEPEELLVDEP